VIEIELELSNWFWTGSCIIEIAVGTRVISKVRSPIFLEIEGNIHFQ